MKKVWPSDDQKAINSPNIKNRHSVKTNSRLPIKSVGAIGGRGDGLVVMPQFSMMA
jgi:hypothetical protein